MKTEVNLEKDRTIIKSFHYPNFVDIPPDGLTRGLWILQKILLILILDYVYQ